MNLDFIVGLLISAFQTAGKDPAVDFLQSIYEKDADLYKALVFTANYGLKQGASAASKSATKIDDQLAAALLSILSASATKNGIVL